MVEHTQQGDADTVRSAETLFDIIEYIHRAEGVTVSKAATDLNYAKSTIHRHLSTLEQRGYVVEDDGYFIGFRFLELGEQARNRRRAYRLAGEKVDELAAETDERAQFIVEEHGDAVYIHRAHGAHAVKTDPGIGKRIPLHATSAGKAILATMTDEEVSRIVEQTAFDDITHKTITDPTELYVELKDIRERGYAFNCQENLDGLHAVGVPITDSDENIIGALSVSGPTHRLTGEWFEDDLPALLLGAANELELNIAHS